MPLHCFLLSGSCTPLTLQALGEVDRQLCVRKLPLLCLLGFIDDMRGEQSEAGRKREARRGAENGPGGGDETSQRSSVSCITHASARREEQKEERSKKQSKTKLENALEKGEELWCVCEEEELVLDTECDACCVCSKVLCLVP